MTSLYALTRQTITGIAVVKHMEPHHFPLAPRRFPPGPPPFFPVDTLTDFPHQFPFPDISLTTPAPAPAPTPTPLLPDKRVALNLISATHADPTTGRGLVGRKAYFEAITDKLPTLGAGQTAWRVSFEYDANFGIPGAFYIHNYMDTEFFLVSLTLDDVLNHGTVYFVCDSWIYNAQKYPTERIFFSNDAYVTNETPAPLVYYRDEELKTLRGDGTGEREEWDRIYDYDVYNDLGEPDKGPTFVRPVLGGSTKFPLPRRVRTGRPPTKTDPKTESRTEREFYIPRDENLGHLILPSIPPPIVDPEFDSFDDVYDLYEGGFKVPIDVYRSKRAQQVPRKFPTPEVIKESKSGWMTDEEFAREIIAGVNPGVVRILQEFPPKSKLDSGVYGDHTSTITKEHIKANLDGLTVDAAIKNKKLFLLDHHDDIFPYLRLINSTPTKAYASRTIFLLKYDGTLKPLAIELSLPHSDGEKFGAVSNVYLPAAEGVEGSIWLLAKAYVLVNDSCFHQIISHWLHTHAVVEPFVIATNRQLSVLHPIYKLLHPHFRDTMNINALARQRLINAGGIIELTFLWGSVAMEMASVTYKDWVFLDQALPADLIKRGMAVEDLASPHGLRLVIEDYPYAVDGLDIWGAIKTWVQEYVSLYYPTDDAVKKDTELQAWWKEVVHEGHADLKDKSWWYKMQTCHELIESCTTLIWTSSALHAAVNFGQYPYGGLILNRPTLSRRFMPEKGTADYDDLVDDYQKAYLMTITPKPLTLLDLSTIEFLSTHGDQEKYLGDRDNAQYWTSDTHALAAFKKFGKALENIEITLGLRNKDEKLTNRVGPVNMPYTLLFPTSKPGITFRGIPNSISI